MVLGLFFDVSMSNTRPEFPRVSVYELIAGNFMSAITLCVVVISLVSQSNILKKLLGIK